MTCRPTLLMIALAILPLMAYSEEPFGRLFFTAEQRQGLDRGRGRSDEQTTAAPTLTVNGVVTRSTGKRTLWVNGVAHHDDGPSGLAIQTSGDDPTTISIVGRDGAPARARVGTTTVRDTGKSVDLLGNGRLSIDARQ